MPAGTYVWQGSHTRYLKAVDYEHITVTGGQVGFDTAKVAGAEFGFVQFLNGPIRALWFPLPAC